MTDLDAALDAVRDVTDGYRADVEHLLRVISVLEGHRDADISRRNHLGEK